MTIVINKKTTRKDIQESLLKLKSKKTNKGTNLDKYCGVLKLKEDPIDIQKRLRDEWR